MTEDQLHSFMAYAINAQKACKTLLDFSTSVGGGWSSYYPIEALKQLRLLRTVLEFELNPDRAARRGIQNDSLEEHPGQKAPGMEENHKSWVGRPLC